MKKITITVFSILMLLALCGFTYENTNSDLVKHEYISTETENVSKIVIADVNADILIKKSDTNSIVVEYYDFSDNPVYTISAVAETLEIEKIYDPNTSVAANPCKPLVVYVPDKQKYEISIYNRGGSIECESIDATKFSANMVSGNITLNNVSADNIELQSRVGDISIGNVVSNSINISGVITNISFDCVLAYNYNCSTGKGNISGTIVGSSNEYSIDSHTFWGSNNLSDKMITDSNNVIYIRTSIGNIDLAFV